MYTHYNEELDARDRDNCGVSAHFDEVHIPLLPKIGVHANIHAILAASVLTIVAAYSGDPRAEALVPTFTRLIPIFFVGLICAVLSILAGFAAYRLASARATGVPRNSVAASLRRSAKPCDSAALSLMALSNLLFLGAAAFGLHASALAFLRA